MRVVYNDKGDRAGLRGYVQFNKYTLDVQYIIFIYIYIFTDTLLCV